jgi:putative transposase
MKHKYSTVTKMWADMGYQGNDLKNNLANKYRIELEVIKRPQKRFWVHKDTPPELHPKAEEGFKVQARRWVAGTNLRLAR